MSTEPLLPSYSSIPEYEWERCPYQHRKCRRVNPTPLTRSTSPIQSLSAPFFVGAVITSTYWAYKSYTASDRVFVYLYLTGLRSLTIFPDPIGTCPFTPLLCVVVPRPLFLFMDWLPTLHPLRPERNFSVPAQACHLDISYRKGGFGVRTRGHLVRVQTILPRHKTTQLDYYVSCDASLVGPSTTDGVLSYPTNNLMEG